MIHFDLPSSQAAGCYRFGAMIVDRVESCVAILHKRGREFALQLGEKTHFVWQSIHCFQGDLCAERTWSLGLNHRVFLPAGVRIQTVRCGHARPAGGV
jgi:hypothetical protein